ncbi:hypothetical protein E2C01_093751 [Portunus trituberculatus]|uniref:Uncharacterized protein n=1 Tax=Portunus trituberculatus TaxID=210409 RepID=A0A5B7JVA7_PORTR|nr:hypothetical protein [Portunus trituberculatus]
MLHASHFLDIILFCLISPHSETHHSLLVPSMFRSDMTNIAARRR